MKHNKKLLSLLLAVVMVFSLSVTAFASWNQFQGNSSHSGLITSDQVPTSTPSLNEALELSKSYDWEAGKGLPGVDAAPIVYGDTAFIAYYGGPGDDSDGGLRVSAVSLSDNPQEVWSTRLLSSRDQDDMDTDNIQQLGTPYYDDTEAVLYVPVTYTKNVLSGLGTPTATRGVRISDTGLVTVNSVGNIYYNDVVIEGNTKMTYFATGITVAQNQVITGSVTFTASDGTTYSYGTSYGYAGYEFCLYNNANVDIPAGTYTVNIYLNSSKSCTGTQPLRGITPYWRLFYLRAYETQAATYGLVAQEADGTYVQGAGQFNTPLTSVTYGGHKYLYFGIYDGDRAYYQFRYAYRNYSDNALTKFVPAEANDGFYWAGAAAVGGNVVFGAENGYLYSRPIGDTFGTATGTKLDLKTVKSDAGAVRSSICYDGTNLYLTTKNAYLWKVAPSLAKSSAKYCEIKDNEFVVNSSSTPVVTENGYVYAGGYNIYWDDDGNSIYKGALKGINALEINNNTRATTLWSAASNGAVQSSPVVYSDGNTNYVYFTANGAHGQAVCLRHTANATSGTTMWSFDSEDYLLQGFAVSDNGYMVFGNDANLAFVIH